MALLFHLGMYAGFDLKTALCTLLVQLSTISILMNTITCKIMLVLKVIASDKNIKLSATEICEFWCQF